MPVPIQLEYQSGRRKSWVPLCLALLIGVPVLLFVGGLFSNWVYEATGDWRRKRYQRANMLEMAEIQQHYLDRSHGPDFVAYDERSDVRLGYSNRYRIAHSVQLHSATHRGVILANDLRSKRYPWTDYFNDVTYSHQRSRPDEVRRLVWCSTHPGWVLGDKRRVPICYWVLSLAQPVYGSCLDLKMTRLGPRLELEKSDVLTLFYGQTDLQDPSAFTFDYLVSGQRGQIVGRLMNDDSIEWTRTFGPGKLVAADPKAESERNATQSPGNASAELNSKPN